MNKKRLMMNEEEIRKKARELLQIPREDLITRYMFQDQEIERLNNIINELEKYFEQEGFWHSLDKVRELKGSDKE